MDPRRIGGLAICASAGYLATAAARTSHIKALALVAPWLQDREIVEQTYGGAAGVARLLEVADTAQAEYQRTGRQTFIPAASTTDERALMFGVPYYTEPERGMITAWRNEIDPAFWRGWLHFDSIQAAPQIAQPLLLVHSEAAAIPQGARKFYQAVKSPKQALWLDGVVQFDFYDRDAPVTAGSDAAARHFREAFAGASTPALADRIAIGDTITRLGLYADQHEWPQLEAVFAPEIIVDYVSLFGGEPQTTNPQALVASWRGMLPGFDATQHMITPVEVQLSDANHATARSYVRATHRLGSDLWIVGGLYNHALVRTAEGWRVSFMQLKLAYEEGDRGLVAKAAQRAQALPPA